MQAIILKLDIQRAAQQLSIKERLVLYGLYHLDHTEESLSQRLLVSRRRVRNLKKDALIKLKKQFVPMMDEASLFVG